MATTYSTNLALSLLGTGDGAGTWGDTTNTNLGTLLEQAISGYVTQTITDGADTVITIPNGSSGVARNMYLELTGTLTAARNLIVPANKKLYFIYNNTTGGYAVTVKVAGQTGVSVPNGNKTILVSNGTDVITAYSGTGNVTFNGNTIGTSSGRLIIYPSTTSTLVNTTTEMSLAGGLNDAGLQVRGSYGTAIIPILAKVEATSGNGYMRTTIAAWNNDNTGDNAFISFFTEQTSATFRGFINYNRGAGLVAYNTSSDYRAKDVYGPVTDSGEKIDAIKIYRGKMHEATIERPMAIAHELAEPAPYAVTGKKDAVDENGKPVYQQVDYTTLVPLLIAEIQSLRARVAALEAK